MVNDFKATIKNSIQEPLNEKPLQNVSKSNYKTSKKLNKTQKSHMKSFHNIEKPEQLLQSSSKEDLKLNEHLKTSSKNATHTKVKSCSWKRSEKSIVPLNTLNSNKKQKTFSKKTANWLKFSSNKTKRQDLNQTLKDSGTTSACRPGTLYSDVLFGPGCSNLVKIKNATPRNYNNTFTNAQKKLTKALFKYNGNQNIEPSDDSEIDSQKFLFPALQKIKNKSYTSSAASHKSNSENVITSVESISNKQQCAFKTFSTGNKDYEDADVVILSDLKCSSLADDNISYGNYLEKHFQNLNDKTETAAASSNKFLFHSILNIPKWNFMNFETDFSDTFPKLLYQFEDENYLKAEKAALLGLKLAMGNSSPPNK